MSRSTLRFFALIVLALLGAPVAMHVVMHDLHGHHEEVATTGIYEATHGDHEHPIVSSSAPQVSRLTRVAVQADITPPATATNWTRITISNRNVRSLGALRMDDDVGLQSLLSTFLI